MPLCMRMWCVLCMCIPYIDDSLSMKFCIYVNEWMSDIFVPPGESFILTSACFLARFRFSIGLFRSVCFLQKYSVFYWLLLPKNWLYDTDIDDTLVMKCVFFKKRNNLRIFSNACWARNRLFLFSFSFYYYRQKNVCLHLCIRL